MASIRVLSSTQKITVKSDRSISITNAGPPGPRGHQGQPGTPGGAPQSYHHEQTTLSADWPVPHNLGYKPALADCEDDAGSKFRPGIEHVDSNNLIAHHVGPMRGFLDLC